jgi:hypothetical protein
MDWAPLDTNRDGRLSAMDALHVINHISRVQAATGEAATGEAEQNGLPSTTQVRTMLVDNVHSEILRDGFGRAVGSNAPRAESAVQGRGKATNSQDFQFQWVGPNHIEPAAPGNCVSRATGIAAIDALLSNREDAVFKHWKPRDLRIPMVG